MSILMWIIVGGIAGLLASLLVGGTGYGLIGDIVIGILGSFVGGWLFKEAGWHAPLAGIAGVIVVAAIGAVLLLVALRFIRSAIRRRT
jgi:uncharacterized membrane protein YeaQ/YmgE (transglycosylase-associated protein family)